MKSHAASAGERERDEADEQHDRPPDAADARLDRREAGEHLQPRVAGPRRAASSASARSGRRCRPCSKPSPAGTGRRRRRARRRAAARPRRRARPGRTCPPRRAARSAARAAPARPPKRAVAGAGPRRDRAATAGAQVVVDGGAAVALDGGEQHGPATAPAERDREQRGEREPRAQAAREPHGRSTQPTPRTVCSDPRLAGRLELAADVADEHVDDVRLDVGRVAPDLARAAGRARAPGPGWRANDLEQVELAAGRARGRARRAWRRGGARR